MKLRYFRVQEKPPLQDVAIAFRQSSILPDRAFTIHFLVGVNGSGKSQLLQTLTEVLLQLAACRKSSLQAVGSRHNHEINDQKPPKTGGCNHQNRPFDQLFPFVSIQ